MKRIVDIDENVYTRLFDCGIQDNEISVDDICEMARALRNSKPVTDVTNEQISAAFQIAIANYWEEKSKYLTPPPTPTQYCDCPNCERFEKGGAEE